MRAPAYDQDAMKPSRPASRPTFQETAMRIQANPAVAATVPAATAKSSRTPHTPAMKPAAAPAKAATVASPAKAAEAAASPETYGGAGSLLDAEA
jgi:hypothetical protein